MKATIVAILVSLVGAGALGAAPVYPLRVGPTGRYLVDQSGVPFLITGESPQSMIANLNEADAELFFINRRAHGFNTVWINLLCNTYTGCRADGSTFDGILPFTGQIGGTSTPDLATPNEAYFARADRILQIAAQYGFLVILDPIETGGWLVVLQGNGLSKARAYGQYLGQRYAGFDNILWMHGNDFRAFPPPTDAALVQAVALGIQDVTTRHLHTVELDSEEGSLDDPSWAPLIQLNASYTYEATYRQVLTDYNRPNFLPVFMVEASYEFENIAGTPGVPLVLRAQEYWSILSGATGQLYGNAYTWPFVDGWKNLLDTPGAAQIAHLMALFTPRRWYELIPDQSHTVVTAGLGVFGSYDYVTAARTPDGHLVMAYVPTPRTLTVDMTQLNGPVTARWYDPAAGTFATIPGSPLPNAGSLNFTTPGGNADGDGDWVLVLEVLASPDTVPPTVAITAPTAGPTHTANTGLLNLAGTASDNDAVTQVSWTNSAGGAGIAVGTTAWSVSGIALQLGINVLIVTARDAAGNTRTATLTVTYDATAPDTTRPTVIITMPTPGQAYTTNTSPLILSGIAVDNVAVTRVSWTNSAGGAGDADGTAAWITGDIVLQNGVNTLTVTALDAAGNTGTATLTVTYDPTPPTVSVIAPTAGATVSRTTSITATASDNIALVGVQFLLDGAPFGAEVMGTGPTYSVTWNTTDVVNGVHTLSARGRDAANNTVLAANVSVTVSNGELAAAYAFSEGAGATFADLSGNHNTGSLGPGVTWTPQGKFDSALVFNGAGIATIPDAPSLDLTTGMTLEVWVYPSGPPNDWTTVLMKEQVGLFKYAIFADSPEGGPAVYINVGPGFTVLRGVIGPSTLPRNAWSHLAATYDTTTLALYVNGTLVASRIVPGGMDPSTGVLNLGGNSIWGEYLQGRIDEVRIYGRVLSQAEIQADMNTPVAGTQLPDTTPPTVVLTAPGSGSALSHVTTISATASDNVGVVGVEFLVDGVSLGVDANAPYSINWNTTTAANGPHTITAIARDAAGNQTSSTAVAVTTVNPAFVNEVVVPGIADATTIKFLPDGRLLVGRLSETILVVQPGQNQPDPTPLLQIDASGLFDEQGLMDIETDPSFAQNGYIYVFYTKSLPQQDNRDRVSRFTVNGNVALVSSELVIWQDDGNSNGDHHGGTVAFGPDGKLYISVGDHFNADEAQRLDSYRGKILRLNPDGSIPTDNPFFDGAGPNKDEIWALGLRNPFRVSFDRVTGRMFIADVGGNDPNTAFEEVNLGSPGANYGWPMCEGPCSVPGVTSPIHSYPHNGRDASITGGFVYRGTQFPSEYQGSYFFADYAQNWIKRLVLDSQGNVLNVMAFDPPDGTSDGPLGDPVKLIEGPDGALYYIDIGFNDQHVPNDSAIRRIRYVLGNLPPVAVAAADPTFGLAPLTVTFTSAGSVDPEGQPLSYTWSFGDGATSSNPNPTHTYQAAGQYIASLSVSDGTNTSLSPTLTIKVGSPPTPVITTPVNGSTFVAGDVISFAGSGTDPEDGSLPPAAFSWTVLFHHEGHVHPALGPLTGTTGGSFQIPTSGHDFQGSTSYEIILTVTDSTGLTATTSVTVFPDKVNLTFDTVPSGLTVEFDGISKVTPFVLGDLKGFQHTINAPDQPSGGIPYRFVTWSDAGARSHGITVPTTNSSYVATFEIVDTTAPDTIITAGPPARTNSSNASFSFTATETGSTFQCALDGGPFAACASPKTYAALAAGSHTFEVLAIDPGGNADPSPASFTWTIDTAAPDTTLTATPPTVTSSTSASFSFTASEAGSIFECRLDAGAFTVCTSPQNLSALASGSHTFQVRAIDPAGNADPTPASFTWTIDSAAPDTTLTTTPPAVTNSTSASFTFTATEAGSTFECKLDGGVFAACASPQNYNALSTGSHTFQVRAIDPAGNADQTPASFTWTIDTTAPDTTITTNPAAVTNSTSASFSFTASEAGSTFQCALDGGVFAACTSPQNYNALGAGSHTFQVRAIDPAGNADPTPASFTWTIDTTAPDTTITANPAAVTKSTSATFTFTASEAGSTLECKLDAGVFAVCTSPQNYNALTAGSHTFQVRAIDPAGNVDPTPASFTWTIDTTGPSVAITAPTTNPILNTGTSPLNIGGTATDNLAVTQVSWVNDRGGNGTASGTSIWTASDIVLQIGTNILTVTALDAAGNTGSAVLTVNYDPTVLDTAITSSPAALTSSTSASFSFTATKAGSTFECKLDGAAFAACASPQSYNALAAGGHTFQVRAIDTGGITDPTPASFAWTVDITPPETTITAVPAPITNSTNATFSFTATEAGSTFQCALDGAAFAACTTPQSYSALTAGSHTFQVRAIDLAGNADPTPASFTWTIDTTAPDTTITATPTAVTNSTNATLSFTATEASSTFQCALDGAAFAACTTPQNYGALTAGSHTFQVRAIDPAGNADPTPASFTWTIDTAAPDTTITANPPTVTSSTSASFNFTATEPGSTFECKLDGGAFGPCSSPQNYSALAAGSHTFQVRATDAAGNTDPTPATFTWTIDTSAPDTTITASPSTLTSSTTATFAFISTKAGSTFECKLDGAVFALCASPQTYNALASGNHTFQVRAVDPTGNADPTPANFTWTIDTTAPDTTVTGSPAAVTNSTSATFSFTATEAGSTFECKLDSGPFVPCTSPQSYSALAAGGHTFQVRAADGAGNTDPTPASFTWTIDTSPPIVTITSPTSGPTYLTSNSVLFASGTASDNLGAPQVTWANNRGGSGTATSVAPGPGWMVNGILLQPGVNVLTITARDGAGNTATATLTVTLGDTTPPTIAITSPTSGPTYHTSNPLLTLAGTASDNVGVTQVTWTNGADRNGVASGTTSWVVNGILLRVGLNVINVTARDAAGNTVTATLRVTLSLDFTDDPLSGGTPVRAAHFTELRSAIDGIRVAFGLPTFDWTDPILVPGVTSTRTVHLTQLRTALTQAYPLAGRTAPTYTDPIVLAEVTTIKADHLNELRSACLALLQ